MPVAIVTGSDSGIGKATAVALAREGYAVGAAVRRLDLSRLPNAAQVVDELAEELGGLDVLVNNAGTSRRAPFLELPWDDWLHTLDVDLNGAFLCGQRAARRMVSAGRGGRIVNVTSVHEHVPLPESAAYVTAKHGLGGLTKQMAFELAEHGITVNAVAPGEIATPMTGNEDVDPHGIERDSVPAGRPGDGREIASLIVGLCSDGAAYATGASFVVDGGLLLTAAAK